MSTPTPPPKKPSVWRVIGRAIGRVLTFFLGKLEWKYHLPWWIVPGIPKLGRLVKKGLGWGLNFRAGRWWVRGLRGVVLAAVVAGAGWGLFQALEDRSGWTNIEVTAPDPTPLEKGATYSLLKLKFSSSAARIDLAGKLVGEGIQMTPSVKGAWRWESDDELLFSPSEDWASGTSYHVVLSQKIFAEGVRLGTSNIDFRTQPFQAKVDNARFDIDPKNAQDRRVWATLVFNYPVDPTSLKDQVRLAVNGDAGPLSPDSLGLEVTYDEFLGKAFLKSGVLKVPKEAISLTLTVGGGIRAKATQQTLSADLKTSITVPGLYDRVAYSGVETAVVRNENYVYEQTMTLSLTGDAQQSPVAAALELWLLPADRADVPGMPNEKNHQWAPSEVDKALLARSQKLSPVALPIENETASTFSFKYQAPSGRVVYARLAGNVTAFGGYIIKDPLKTTFRVPDVPKSLEIMHNGSVLSLNGDKTISVVSNDVRTVRFRVSRLFPDQVNHLITQTNGTFSSPEFREPWLFSELDMSTVYSEIRDLAVGEPGAVQYQSFNFGPYLLKATDPQEKYGLFLFHVAEYDKDKQTEVGEGSRRFILITDLGLLAKRNADGSSEVFVQDIKTGRPRSGAQVEVLGRNGVPVFNGLTDSKGQVHVPDLGGASPEKEPVVYTARSNGDMSFLPLSREDRFLTFTRFDVGGEHGAADPEKVTALLFSDRGLYRPGDTVHLGSIVKAGDWARSLADLPLELKVYDPRGIEVQKTLIKLPASGFFDSQYRTLDSATPGTWRFELSLVKDEKTRTFLGSCSVRVEDFAPDRLTINARIPSADDRAWIPFSSVGAEIHLANLYGLPAVGNTIQGSFRLLPQALTFPQYPDFRFDDAFTTDKFHEESLPTTVTDSKGDAHIDLDLTKFEPATFQVLLSVEGLENQGGRGVSAEASVIVSPLEWIVGWKADGRLDYIPKGSVRTVQFVAIDPHRKTVAGPGLKYNVDEIRFVSVLTKREDGSYQYQSVRKKIRVASGDFDLGAQGRTWSLDSSSPGDFELTLTDGADRVVAKTAYSVIGKGNLSRSLDRNAELEIRLDKADYNPGESIELQIKAPYAGSGLITIERDKVYATQWFTTDTNASIQHITVPANVEGNAYVNVSFVRASDSPEIYMSPLSYGVQPFRVNLNKRRIDLNVTAPAEAKPGRPFVMTVRADRPAHVVVYAVDEGILQVAKYKTPKPLDFFFKKRALEVSTSQILDMILPEFSVVQSLMAMGGDAEGLSSHQNPFKRKNREPVAFWSGILEVGPEGRTVTYNVPSYFNGTLRVMAVAVSDNAIGVTEQRSLVRNDYIITPSLPTFVAPGDEFLMGVTVANNAPVGSSKNVVLGVTGDHGVSLEGDSQKTLTLERNTEKTVWFKVKAGPTSGVAQVHFVAGTGSSASDLTEELSVRPAVPWTEKIDSGILRTGTTTLSLPRTLSPDLRKLSLSLSFQPAALNTGLLGYLSDYPYGCTEQILSKAFPSLLLLSAPNSTINRAKAEQSFAEAVKVLGARQNEAGGFGLWSGSEDTDDFVTVYAVHFLTEAAARGYRSGESIRQTALAYLKDRWFGSDGGALVAEPQVAAYAAWVLALDGQVSTNLVLDVRKALEKQGGDWKKNPAVLYLAGASSILKQQTEADRLLADYGDGAPAQDEENYYDSDLYRSALQVYMNSLYRSNNPVADNQRVLESLVSLVGGNHFSTYSSAWAILAFQAYSQKVPQVNAKTVTVEGKAKDGQSRAVGIEPGDRVAQGYAADLTALTVTNKAEAPLYWQTVQSGFDDPAPTQALSSGLEVFREYQDASGKAVTSIQRGQSLTAVIKVRTTGKAPSGGVAVVDLLPGGLELALDQQGNRSFGELIQGNFQVSSAEAREDRVVVFGQVTSKLTEIRYPVKATTAGTFALPVTQAEALYDRTKLARTAAGTFTVTE